MGALFPIVALRGGVRQAGDSPSGSSQRNMIRDTAYHAIAQHEVIDRENMPRRMQK